LRGDKASLPRWEYQIADTQPELKKTIDTFKTDMRAHLYREELRLMYVAVTRPKKFLLMTGSYWKPGAKNAKVPSKFLIKAAELDPQRVEIINRDEDTIVPPLAATENPTADSSQTQEWPLDPLGKNHGPKVRAAEQLVRQALEAVANAQAAGQIDEIELLLREREERVAASMQVQLPVRINASAFKDFVSKTEETAARMLRPIPVEPFKATRAGTIFHSMMEQRFAGLARVLADNPEVDLADAGDELWAEQLDAVDLAEHQATIAELQATFATSKWANQVPYAAEIEIQLAIANNIFICKLDAVFATQDANGNQRFELVDWQTGKAPTDAQDIADRSLQLALYRLAFATLKQIPLESVDACLYFVSENQVVTPPTLLNRQQLLERWAAVTA
jgi:DNA helicase-2/ATP-dependent DNA helicase PcrA